MRTTQHEMKERLEAARYNNDDFITVWRVPAKQVLKLPIEGDFRIDWGDGCIDTLKGVEQSCEHVYDKAGDYAVKVSNAAKWGWDGLDFLHLEVNDKLIDVAQWGTTKWASIGLFTGCHNMDMSATDAPDLSRCTSLTSTFSDCHAFNGSIEHWDVSTITSMDCLFYGASSFNQPLEKWDVSNVTGQFGMFLGASSFNQPLEKWDVSSVTDMTDMFNGASSFNQPLGDWAIVETSSAKIAYMFNHADAFCQDLSKWTAETGKGSFGDEFPDKFRPSTR